MDDLIEALEKIRQDVQCLHYEIECLQAEKKMWFCLQDGGSFPEERNVKL